MESVTAERKKGDRKKKGAVVLFFLFFFLYGCAVFRDYGIGVDEPVERKSSLIVWLHLNPSLCDVATDTVDFSWLPPLREYQDRYYGVTVMLPCVVVEHLTGFTMPLSRVYAMRHFYNFLLFFIGTLFFYLLCREMGFGRKLALTGVLFLILSPRILSDAFYNSKDLIFLSLFAAALYAAVRFLKQPSIQNTLGLSAVSALCANVRMIGAYLPALVLAAGMISCCREFFLNVFCLEKKEDVSGRNRSGWRLRLLFVLAAGALSLIFYILLTPVVWDDPPGRMKEIAAHFSDYSVWNDYNYYMGRYITREEIPWHYLPVWMGITIPPVTLMLAAGGFCLEMVRLAVFWRAARKENAAFFRERLLIWLLLALPLVYVMWKKPAIYNGWRHFYFLYPLFCLHALYTVKYLQKQLENKKKKVRTAGNRCLWTVIAAGFLSTILWISKNHPYDYVYFNELAREWALPRFDKDYWGVSERDALKEICSWDKRKEIRVFLLTDFSLPLLPEEDRNRISRVRTMEEAEYYVHGYHAGALGGLPEGSKGMKPWRQIMTDGYPIRTIYKRE